MGVGPVQTEVQRYAEDPAFSSRYAPLGAERARTYAALGARWTLDSDGLSVLTSSELTTSSSKIAASSGGTDGSAVLPFLGPREDFRASFELTATKATASSKSYIGVTVSSKGVLPTGTGPTTAGTFGVGYLAGSGICMFRENVSTNSVLYADASITDGDVFTVELTSFPTQDIAAASTTPALYATIRNSAGTVVYQGAAVTYNTEFYDPKNVIIRTNVAAGGLGKVSIATGNPFAPGNTEAFSVPNWPGLASETVGLRLPVSPNGRVVFHLHGHGATPASIINDSTLKACYEALTKAGYTLVIPAMGGNLWGNTAALGQVLDLWEDLTDTYGLDPAGCYLWGNSMGGGAACTLISDGVLPVKAAYLSQPAVDYDTISANPSFSSINTAYPSEALRDASNPLMRSASSYAGVPLYITASASDTAISKTGNADALVTLVSGQTTVIQIAASGDHNNASHFRPGDMVQFFQSHP